MTDMIIISRKEIEDWINRNQRWAQHSACDGDLVVVAQDLRALLDKAEVVSGEPVAYIHALVLEKRQGLGCEVAYFKPNENSIPLYTTPQPSRIVELEAEIARLKAIP